MKVTAIVPSYKPDEKLAGVLRDLAAAGFERIIVVMTAAALSMRLTSARRRAIPSASCSGMK